ncbi:MAG: hypothetical protein KME26_04890 [Oscillatoria princeps RMCB-10]|nr:hypothetical protein [Oscillatoria princeps RMCB-10]
MSFSTAALAGSTDPQYFKTGSDARSEFGFVRHIYFVPADTQKYSYQIQWAGIQVGTGNLVCNRFAARTEDRVRWDQIGFRFNLNPNSGVVASAGDVVEVYGGTVGNPTVHSLHFRVAVSDNQGNLVYKTRWEGGDDIVNWNWPSECSWVKE